jgi:predicted DNA-binding protein (MmcQ/YjbR family)
MGRDDLLIPQQLTHMNIEELRTYCLSKKGVTEEFPFDETTLVFKVMGKMFALTGLDSVETTMNLKCKPDYAVELREQFSDDIIAGWHMNKLHWNTVNYSGGLKDPFVKELVDHSYDLVVSGLTKKQKEELGKK